MDLLRCNPRLESRTRQLPDRFEPANAGYFAAERVAEDHAIGKNIKGRRSKTAYRSEAYRNTSRHARRLQRKSTNAVHIPPILGWYTDILVALADGPRRRVNLEARFTEARLRQIVQRDLAGLMTTYRLPNLKRVPGSHPGRGGTKRGMAIAINPAFPLVGPLSSLLRRLATESGFSVEGDMSRRSRSRATEQASRHLSALRLPDADKGAISTVMFIRSRSQLALIPRRSRRVAALS